ncbi:MAG: beta-propeller domain-containing protein, partial [Candidatus Absconditabacteria bacterium]|nr:beta-propeller domain-containing protein [Candidatus Absconditabacteria bacterium]
MKKFGFFLSLGLVFLFSFSFAAIEDTQIVDELNKKQQEEMLQQSQDLTENFTFNQVNSCDAMETVFSDFLELYKKYYPKRDYSLWDMIAGGFGGDFGVVMTDTMETESVSATVENQKILVPQVGGATDDSFSTTNLQKVGVDEPEIFKSNGKYLFYYVQDSTNQKYVSVIKAPTTSDLQDAEIVKKILIPTSLSNVQLFLQGDILVILASRYSNIQSDVLGSQHTVAIIYDISDLNDLKLQKMVDVVGSFSDARVIGDDLYLISQINLNWYSFAYDLPVIRFSDVIPQTTQLILDEQGDKEVQLGSKALSYQKQTLKAPCKDIFYLLPTEEALKEYGALPNFTLVSKISLSNTSQSVTQKVVFGNTDTVHMSQNSLYLPSPLYFSSPMRCLGCWWPNYGAGQNTLVHKMNLTTNLNYEGSKIIPGIPLSQYSMDEDAAGNFRILTKTWSPSLATQFFVFDKNFSLAGQLLNIEPGEEFKSSRYIGDKLYLVTFQQIDPLFVVDIANIKKPTIVGELKIPGYSTYLHPYEGLQGGIQYLIGLGYSTQENQRGGVTND